MVKVIFISKPGCIMSKLNPFIPSASPTPLKTMDRLVDRYIHLHQHTYQTGRSVNTALHSLYYKIEKVFKNRLVLWELSWTFRVQLAPPLGPRIKQLNNIGEYVVRWIHAAQLFIECERPNGLYVEGVCQPVRVTFSLRWAWRLMGSLYDSRERAWIHNAILMTNW
jgi:hypothetical protein